MENIELGTEINITEMMSQANKPGNSGVPAVTGDKTVMENVVLGTEQNIMQSVMEDTVKASLAKDTTSKAKKVQKKNNRNKQKQCHSTPKSSMELMVCY